MAIMRWLLDTYRVRFGVQSRKIGSKRNKRKSGFSLGYGVINQSNLFVHSSKKPPYWGLFACGMEK
jgi:hypothetical protein